jgi:hypothetical protein
MKRKLEAVKWGEKETAIYKVECENTRKEKLADSIIFEIW